MRASLTFRVMVMSWERYAFLTYCWVMVLAPSTASPALMST
jgi:hypothetical protein